MQRDRKTEKHRIECSRAVDYYRFCNIHVMGIPEEEKREKGREDIYSNSGQRFLN